jgi:hypothetical protein
MMTLSTLPIRWAFRGKNNRPAHIWIGSDTACRMASTGGLNIRRYTIADTRGSRDVCFMCRKVTGFRDGATCDDANIL